MVKTNPIKMKISELQSELESRNINASKNLEKQELVVLLLSALQKEGVLENDGSYHENIQDVQCEESNMNTGEEMQTENSAVQPIVEDKKNSNALQITKVKNRKEEQMEKETALNNESSRDEKTTKEERPGNDEGKENPDLSSDGKKSSENDHSSRKRHHEDHNPDESSRKPLRCPPVPDEPEEDFDDSLVVLDKYNSDLNIKLLNNRCTGQTFSMEGFAYLWAGAKATHGVRSGRVCYECKLLEDHSVRHLSSAEPNRHLVRLGWSSQLCGLQLGEEECSYAYCGTGKVITDKLAEEYGELFKEGDVMGCYIDFTGNNDVTISFTKNGISLGVGFTVEKAKLNNKVLFPHVLCKNMTVELNFGQKEEPYFAHPENFKDYVFLASVPEEQRTRGAIGASTSKECEVLMLVGLPGAGKTHWARNHVVENSQKNYNVLGMNAILERMKVSGLENKTPRGLLMAHAFSCLNRLMQIASRKKRNFILDLDVNVSSSAQRRNMQYFAGYQRKAIVIVPSDEEFKSRLENRSKQDAERTSDVAMYQIKGNFAIPEVGDIFEEVIFPELNKEDLIKLIEQYREEAKDKGPPPEKRFRGGFSGGCRIDNRAMGGRSSSFGAVNVRTPSNQRASVITYGGNWQQNRNLASPRGGFKVANRMGYGGKQSGDFNKRLGHKSCTISNQDHDRNGDDDSTEETSLSPQYHQGYNAHSQPDYSQQWAQYYQQQTTIQQQPATVVAAAPQYQNHYTSYQKVCDDSYSAVM